MEKLGIQPVQLVTQIFNFLVLVVVLTKFLYKPTLKMLDERKKKIEEGLLLTDKMREEKEKLDKKGEQILNKAKDEAASIIEEGKKTAKNLEKDILAKAQNEAREIVAKSKRDAVLAREEEEKKLEEKTVEVAGLMVEKLLSELPEKTKREILDKKLTLLTQRN
ncbi:MAG: ATP synthase subunit b [Candidatus Gottesmanbacteria bacterium GW2011_GWC2_39_8]|uniref:ATP synthase subunit b n=1 Tax=Candidatus Gottesmanbacteria bacterium GW2011_GWC2_39_8 TaxID=1618450 RepID=A0A0G0T059_9BACT|nr:MAG: ATP synthase subunit b [Candidatus Gottesmanbacteria bacterium GW2011_GWC2_39_8]